MFSEAMCLEIRDSPFRDDRALLERCRSSSDFPDNIAMKPSIAGQEVIHYFFAIGGCLHLVQIKIGSK